MLCINTCSCFNNEMDFHVRALPRSQTNSTEVGGIKNCEKI